MNSKTTLAVLGTAVLCGFALAQTPKTPAERLDALEKEVAALRAQSGAPAAASTDVVALQKELAEQRALTKQLVLWVNAQAKGAQALSAVLDESEQKGFTYGINPDSRSVLLAGWREFNAGLQTDVPEPPPSPAEAPKGRGRGTR